jgi:hypothetical protein
LKHSTTQTIVTFLAVVGFGGRGFVSSFDMHDNVALSLWPANAENVSLNFLISKLLDMSQISVFSSWERERGTLNQLLPKFQMAHISLTRLVNS